MAGRNTQANSRRKVKRHSAASRNQFSENQIEHDDEDEHEHEKFARFATIRTDTNAKESGTNGIELKKRAAPVRESPPLQSSHL